MSNTQPSRSLSIVLPAYNEEEELSKTVSTIRNWAENEKEPGIRDVEIIIVEDGCTDNTPDISADLAEQYENVTHLHFEERLGKGKAITNGFASAESEILCFMDVDRATNLSCLNALIAPIQDGTADVAIGSRYIEDSETDRSRTRDVLSKGYNRLTSSLLGTGVTDHQCGFKAVSNDVFHAIENNIVADRWFWDTEFLYTAQQHGYRIKEVPVRWTADNDSEVTITTVGVELLRGVTRLKGQELLGERYASTAKYVKFATVGAFGAILNTAILFLLTEFFGVYYLFSAFAAIEAAIITMFFLNNRFTFSNGKSGLTELIGGIMRSNMVRALGTVVQIGMLYAFTEFAGIYYLVSNILAIFLASIFNFFGEKRFNWKE